MLLHLFLREGHNVIAMTDAKILQAIFDKLNEIGEDLRGFKSMVYKRFDNLDERVDSLGMQIANLEDDAPTREELENLEHKVEKLQARVTTT